MMIRLALAFPAFWLLIFTFVPQTSNLDVRSLESALAANPSGATADALAQQIRVWIGPEIANLAKLPPPKVDDLAVAWAIEVADAAAPPKVVPDDGRPAITLTRVGSTNVYAAVKHFNWGDGFRWRYVIGDRNLVAGNGQLEVYTTPPENKKQPGVPEGKLIEMPKWKSKIFEGTTRDWWVYVPAQYRATAPACVSVFQDGQGAKNYTPVVLDNLIAKGEIPVTVAIFIAPGVKADGKPNRSFEYDTLSDQYARFLLEEILPEVEKTHKLRHDPASRLIAGISSGGICAWTVAWERPNEFGKVLSWVGSFTDIAHGASMREGGHNYAALIRKLDKKPIRIFMQDGENDLDNVHGSWPLANQTFAKALEFKGYDYKFEYGHGFHSDRHGRALLPASLKWLWRDYKVEP
jgi:enterochelin esterase-like enzyme